MADETIDELLARVHAATGHGLHIDTHQTEPRVTIEYDTTKRQRAVGDSLEGVLRAILEREDLLGQGGPITLEIDLEGLDEP